VSQSVLTWLGFASKIVVTGDPTQNDLARGERSGLADVSEVLPGIPGIEFVIFGSEDVVRHKLVQRIVSAYKERGEQRERAGRRRAAVAIRLSRAPAQRGSTSVRFAASRSRCSRPRASTAPGRSASRS